MDIITIDFETYYSKEYSLSKMTTEAYIRDPRFQIIGVSAKINDGPIEWITGETPIIKARLKELDLDSNAVLCHNTAFDGAILSWVLDIHPKLLLDTLSMARPHTGLTVGGSLRALATQYQLGEKGTEIYNTLGKRREDFTPDELAAFGEYCRQDVNLTWKLYQVLLPLTPQKELYLINLSLKMFTEPKIVLDKPRLEAHLADVRAKKAKLMSKVSVDKTEIMSNPRFAELLKAEGVEPPMKVSPTTGKQTYAFAKTDEAFKALLEHPNENVQALVACRLGCKSTIEETRTEALIGVAERGPLPILLNYYGGATGRYSGGEKLNLQNLPRGGEIRKSLVAPPGHSLVACDSSNIEGRCNAFFSGQTDLVEQFRQGVDIYCDFASKVFGRPITKKDKKERMVGKVCILGLGFGTGADKLQATLKLGGVEVDTNEAKRIVKTYRTTYDRIAAMWRMESWVLDQMLAGVTGCFGNDIILTFTPDRIYLPSGRFLYYPDLRFDPQTNEVNYRRTRYRARLYGPKLHENIIQSLARDIVMYQMCTINQMLQEMGGNSNGKIRQIVLSVHDETVVIVPDEEAEDVKKMMEVVMSTSPGWCSRIPLACEAGIGKSYGDAK